MRLGRDILVGSGGGAFAAGKPVGICLALAFATAGLLIWDPRWSFAPPVYLAFYSTALFLLVLCQRFQSIAQHCFDLVAEFSDRRGAFHSDPILERPKFALIRILFGLFMVERAFWIIAFLYPSDWGDPLIISVVFGNLLAALFVFFGFFTQASLAYLILFQWQFGDATLGTGTLGNDIGAMLALLLMFVNAGAHYSVDALLLKQQGLWGRVTRAFYFDHGLPSTSVVQNAKLVAMASYWFVCVYSLMMHVSESAWMTGTAGPHLLSNNFMSRYAEEFEAFFQQGDWAVIFGRVALWGMLPWYALVLPLLFLGRIARAYVIIWGLLFFVLSGFVLQLGWLAHFEFLLFAALFWERSFIGNPGSLQVAYDDRCNLCDRTVTTIKWLDVFRRVKLRPVSTSREWLAEQGINEADAMTDLYGVDSLRGDRKTAGYDFYITLTRNVLLLLPAYPVLLLGKVTGIGPRIYRFIADRRVRLFGVCQIPTKKPTHAAALTEAPLQSGVVCPAISAHVLLLGFLFLLVTPAPFAGWQGMPLPSKVRPAVMSAAEAAHVYGITPIDVFNRTDLRMAENWFTLSTIDESGEEVVLPVFNDRGQRLHMHRSDRIYFGNTIQIRRSMIGGEGCQFRSYQAPVRQIASRAVGEDGEGSTLVYRQFHRPLADDESMISGRYVRDEPEVVCEVRFGLSG